MTQETKDKLSEIADTLSLLADQLRELTAEPQEPQVRQAPPAPQRPKITLNDRFRFVRELFGGDASAYERAVDAICGGDNPADHIAGTDKPEAAELLDILNKFADER